MLTFKDPKIELLLEFTALVGKQMVAGPIVHKIPFHSYLPFEVNRNIKRAKEITSSMIPPVLQSNLETYTPGVIRDMTDSFISAYKKKIAKETTKDIGTINDIEGLMLDVIFAGSDTTSSSLAWFLFCIASFPEIQKKIHDELDQKIDKDDLPPLQDVQNMPYLQATIVKLCVGVTQYQ